MTADTTRHPLRVWPGLALAALLLTARFGLPLVSPDLMLRGLMGSLAAGVLILVWWLFFSRAPWGERFGILAFLVAATWATSFVVHESIAAGAMGVLHYLLAVPLVLVALAVGAAVARNAPTGPRRATLLGAIVLACLSMTLVRTAGFDGSGDNDISWRWAPSAEERLLASAAGGVGALPPPPAALPTPFPAGDSDVATGGDQQASAEDLTATGAGSEQTSPDAAVPPSPAGGRPEVDGSGDASARSPDGTSEIHAATEAPVDAVAPDPLPAPRRAEWPGFRGAGRDGVVTGSRIATDWSVAPPVELWRRPVGPGWSSFAVAGGRAFTQEQRGDDEVVAGYDTATGEPVWAHRDAARFWESNAGAGPRGTPTVSDGRVYSLGATGLVNALDAATGARVWSRDAAADTGARLPTWGFSGSPLVLDELVVVAASGRLVAYDRATGEPRWTGPEAGPSYVSPQLLSLDGVEQIVLAHGGGSVGVDPASGAVLWSHEQKGYPIVQPALAPDGALLVTASEQSGIRRLGLSRDAAGEWTATEQWTSIRLKPYFNDFVVHDGHAYGFDGSILAAMELANGDRAWKGGRYGHGQLVLLAEQGLLLILGEKGELVLVEATPAGHREVARHQVLEGKTWNHPVVVDDLLLVRNDHEMAAYRLPSEGGGDAVARVETGGASR